MMNMQRHERRGKRQKRLAGSVSAASSFRSKTKRDLRDLPEDARKEMEFIVAEHVHEVLRAAIPGISEQSLLRVAA